MNFSLRLETTQMLTAVAERFSNKLYTHRFLCVSACGVDSKTVQGPKVISGHTIEASNVAQPC